MIGWAIVDTLSQLNYLSLSANISGSSMVFVSESERAILFARESDAQAYAERYLRNMTFEIKKVSYDQQ